MGRTFTATVTATVSSTTDIIKLLAPATKSLIVKSAWVTVDSSVEDRMEIFLQRATGGAVIAAVIPEKHDSGDSAFGGTVANLVGQTQSTLTALPIIQENVDVRAGFFWQPPPNEYITLPGAGILILHSSIAITSASIKAQITFEEIG